MTEKKTGAVVDKKRSLAILGEVFDVETALRSILKNIAKKVGFIPEIIVEANTGTNVPHKRSQQDLRKVEKDVEKAIDDLTLFEIKEILAMEPANLVRPETITKIILESKDFSDAQRRVRALVPTGTLLSIISNLILAEKVNEEKFLKLLAELVGLRNAAAHWRPISQKNVDRAKELREEILSMLKFALPKISLSELSEFQTRLQSIFKATSIMQEKQILDSVRESLKLIEFDKNYFAEALKKLQK